MATDDGTPTGIQYDDPMDRFDSIADIQRKMASQKAVKEQAYADLIREAATRNTQISPSQGFALTALAALPLIAGKFLSGRTKGATALDAGAAGLQAIQGYNQNLEQNDEVRRAGLEKRANNLAGELNILRSQEAALPGTFIKNQLDIEGEKRRQNNELALIQAKANANRPDPALVQAQQRAATAAQAGELPSKEDANLLASTENGVRILNSINEVAKRTATEKRIQGQFEAESMLAQKIGGGNVSGEILPEYKIEWTDPNNRSPKVAAAVNEEVTHINMLGTATSDLFAAMDAGDPGAYQAARSQLQRVKDQKANGGAALSASEILEKFGDLPPRATDLKRKAQDAAFRISVQSVLQQGLKNSQGEFEARLKSMPSIRFTKVEKPTQDPSMQSKEAQYYEEELAKIRQNKAANGGVNG